MVRTYLLSLANRRAKCVPAIMEVALGVMPVRRKKQLLNLRDSPFAVGNFDAKLNGSLMTLVDKILDWHIEVDLNLPLDIEAEVWYRARTCA